MIIYRKIFLKISIWTYKGYIGVISITLSGSGIGLSIVRSVCGAHGFDPRLSYQ